MRIKERLGWSAGNLKKYKVEEKCGTDPTILTILPSRSWMALEGVFSPNLTCTFLGRKSNWGCCFQNFPSTMSFSSNSPSVESSSSVAAPSHILEMKFCKCVKEGFGSLHATKQQLWPCHELGCDLSIKRPPPQSELPGCKFDFWEFLSLGLWFG